MESKKWIRTAGTWATVLAGNALLAFLVAAFIMPHDIIMGGTTGIGIVIGEATGMDTALLVFIMNVILLILGGIILGRKFFVTTAASSVLYPAFLAVMQRIPNIGSFTDDPLLSCLFGGALLGISLGMVMRVGSSTGGMDVVSLLCNRWFRIPVSVCVYLLDFAVLGAQALFRTPEQILYGILMLVLESLVLDQVMIIGMAQIQILAISTQAQRIRARLLEELDSGVTMIKIETGRLNQQGHGVLCVIPPRKVHQAIDLIRAEDSEVFMTITKIKEVHGRGFTSERRSFPVTTSAEYTLENLEE